MKRWVSAQLVRADTGSGKTLIAIMLMRQVAAQPVPPGSPHSLIVFLTPTTTLVPQQAQVIESQTTLRVKSFVGAQGVDYWHRERWQEEFAQADAIVLTPQIWLNCLNNRYFDLRNVSLMIFDEAHHAQKNHPCAVLMRLHYHPLKTAGERVPRILGLTASPIWNVKQPEAAIDRLESTLDVRILEVAKVHRDDMETHSPRAVESLLEHMPPTAAQKEVPHSVRQISDQLSHIWTRDDRLFGRVVKAQALFGSAGTELYLAQLAKEHKVTEQVAPALDDLARVSVARHELSPKVGALIECLETYRDEPLFHAIIFVEQRHHAAILSALLARVPSLQTWVRPAALVGHGRQGWARMAGASSETEIGMAVKEQQAIVAAFRAGEYNLLVATRVAEEGLDFRSCNLVIRFDSLTTITGYVQSRGRARHAHAKYVVLAEAGSDEAAKYHEYVRQEKELQELYGSRPDDVFDSYEPDLDGLPTYATSTGALLTHYSSIALVSEYFSILRFDAFTPLQQPEYHIVGAGTAWTATVKVPKTAALDCTVFISDVMPSKKAAKQRAAFKVAIELHRSGALDDHLIPYRPRRVKGAKDADGRDIDDSVVPKHLEISLVNHYGNVWTAETAFVHVVEIDVPSGPTRLALVCGVAMPPLDPATLFTRDGAPFGVRTVRVQELQWSDENERAQRLTQLERFNRDVVRIVLNRRIGDDERFYALWAPCTAADDLDWDAIERPFAPLQVKKAQPGDLVLVPFRRPTARIGTFEHVRDDVTSASSTSEIERGAPASKLKIIRRYPDYHVYLKVCYAFHDLGPGAPEPIVQFAPLDVRPHNALVPPEQRFGLAPKPYHHSRSFPSSMLRCTSLPTSFFAAFSFTPALNRLLSGRQAAAGAVQHLNLPQIDLARLDEALTTPASVCGYDYQLLETLGDSMLKLATTVHIYLEHRRADEDHLTRLRENSVDNRSLRQRSLTSGLSAFLLPHTLRTLTFVPETSDDVVVAPDGLSMTKRLPRRVLSDTVEATLGAAVLTGGLETARKVGDRLSLCFGGTKPWHERPSARELLDVEPHPAGLAFNAIEAALGYTFTRQGALLVQAITHRSYAANNVYCYEREEYLGDAILDQWATMRIYERFPQSTPATLTFKRALLVSNGCLALIALRTLGLHKTILHSSPSLEGAMREAAELANGFDWKDVVEGDLTFLWSPPKVLGDVVEALLAVVFVDCGMQLEPIYAVLDKLYADIMPHLRDDGVRDPYSRLMLWRDSQACTELSIKITRLTSPDQLGSLPSSSSPSSIQPSEDSPFHRATCTYHGRALATRESSSKAVARQLAARDALAVLGGEADGACGCRAKRQEEKRREKEAREDEKDGQELVEDVDEAEEEVEDEAGRAVPVAHRLDDVDEDDENGEASGETSTAEEPSLEEPQPLQRVREY
ncbi:hypothetical protein Rhopal_000807-T1 [Rhodotorula paludigena]|uniref:P-loop containing nucleoside triphosphate hydrolase protein n=1 Tax=Rhodotorula paludigena TaxID=86838 RepID=A0AAV5GET2_9BASI|nr:hypothetical protein Rhopal_000807-T1 [Rhodotorula paludigena]